MVAGLGGDAVAYRVLLVRLSSHLRAFFSRRLAGLGRDGADSEDLVQEALLAIHRSRHTYDPGEPFTPWVHAIARYKLTDHLRLMRAPAANLPLEEAEALVAEVDDHVAAESAADLSVLLDQLPAKMRSAIRCVKIEGLSVVETARRCGMSKSAVKTNVHRGLRALSQLIGRRRDP